MQEYPIGDSYVTCLAVSGSFGPSKRGTWKALIHRGGHSLKSLQATFFGGGRGYIGCFIVTIRAYAVFGIPGQFQTMHSHHCGRRPGRSIQTRSSAWAPASVKGWPRVLDTPRNLMFKKKQTKTCINKTSVTSPGQGSHFNFQVRHLLLRRWRLLRR